MTDRVDLQALFDAFNEQYFGDRLATHSVTWSDTTFTFRRGGDLLGATFNDRHAIEIHSSVTGPLIRRILLHEMCHVECRNDPRMHGPCFMNCLQRLVAAEPTLAAEIEDYRDRPTPDYPPGISRSAALWSAILSEIYYYPDRTWADARLALAAAMDNTSTEAFDAEFPQAQTEWIQAAERARRLRFLQEER